MDRTRRRAAASAYKERKHIAGVFAVRCTATDEVWVGASPTIETIQNQLWFSFRLGSSPQRDIQRALAIHGEQAFSFQVLEVHDEARATLVPAVWLKHRAAEWRAQLGAKKM